MTTRRSFLAALGAAGAAPAFAPDALRVLARAAERGSGAPDDEAYWSTIQRAFDADRSLINLNNGGVSPCPTHVLDQMIRDLRFSNELPVEHMWRILEPRLETVRTELAREFGCDREEMAITRNASEALEIVILGLDLKPGDEVIVSNQNYPRMITSWEQRVRRDGIVLRQVSFKVPPPSPQHVVDAFAAAITPRTRVLEITHITNLTGQVLPVREVVTLARAKGIEVLVDGAHAFAHFPFTRDELGCDYYGTSLHKWLLAPIGTGFLYVRREKIPRVWPLMPAPASLDADIRKFEEIGTHPAANHNAIAAALAFHRGLGAARKAARLRFLRDRWMRRLDGAGGRVRILTPYDPRQGGAIGFVSVDGLDAVALGSWLMQRHRIVSTPIVHPEFTGLRITPNVYTTLDEVDRFAEAMEAALRTGIGG